MHTEEESRVKTGMRLDPKRLPPLSFPADALLLSELVAASHNSNMFRLKLDFHLLAVVIFAFGSEIRDYSLGGRYSQVSCCIAFGRFSASGPCVVLFD